MNFLKMTPEKLNSLQFSFLFNVKFMRKWFTLMEIMIVIAIISILMTITMRFWSKRIDDLGYQAGKEQFISEYDKLYSQATTSNYHAWIRYDILHLILNSGTNLLNYAYDSGAIEWINFSIPLALSWLEETRLDLQPYTLWCTIMNVVNDEISTWASVDFSLVVKEQKQYCFSIKNDTCKLIEQKCE